MADVSKITINDVTYNLKDSESRNHLSDQSNPHKVTKAQVGLSNVIDIDQSKAIKNITRSGTTFTATALDGTTFTFNQQDTDTTYSVATTSDDGLMSKADKSKLDGITSTYATKSELSSHSQNISNPHQVTASQVGALPLSGGSLTGKLTVPSIETGTQGANYFQTKKMRGEGNADSYYHAIDFGYGGHNQVDFYEYGGKYVFHRHMEAAQSRGDTVIGEINGNGFVGKVNGHTINADVPAGAKFTDTTYSNATSSADGLMSKADKAKLDGIGTGSNVKSVNGKTGAVTLAKGDVGLANVANYDQSKAIKSITRSGTTFTATALDGTTSTFTQQDTDTTYSVFTGATASSGGSTGLVPKPTIEDVDKYLCSDGTWKTVSGGTSDAPVRVSGSVYENNIKSGTITAYRIGHLLYICSEGITVDFKDPMLKIFVINSIDGFSIKNSATPWVSFDMGDGVPESFGIVLINTDRSIYVIGD